MKQPQQDFEVDYVDRLGGILLKLISPEWFKAIFRKSYGTLLLLAIYAGCTVGAVLSADYKVLSTILFILPWLCTRSFVLGGITQFDDNKGKDDDKKIGFFKGIVPYVLLALSNGGMYTMLWLWGKDCFMVIENASASVGSVWIAALYAIFTQTFFMFVVVCLFVLFCAFWVWIFLRLRVAGSYIEEIKDSQIDENDDITSQPPKETNSAPEPQKGPAGPAPLLIEKQGSSCTL